MSFYDTGVQASICHLNLKDRQQYVINLTVHWDGQERTLKRNFMAVETKTEPFEGGRMGHFTMKDLDKDRDETDLTFTVNQGKRLFKGDLLWNDGQGNSATLNDIDEYDYSDIYGETDANASIGGISLQDQAEYLIDFTFHIVIDGQEQQVEFKNRRFVAQKLTRKHAKSIMENYILVTDLDWWENMVSGEKPKKRISGMADIYENAQNLNYNFSIQIFNGESIKIGGKFNEDADGCYCILDGIREA